MEYLNKDIVFAFGLIFRILFYSTFISLMFFQKAVKTRRKFKKQISIIILFFAICYVGYLIPFFFDNKNHGGLPEMFIVVWCLFFFYLFLLNNHDKVIINLNKIQSNILTVISITFILFCNSLLNFPTSGVVWISGWIGGIIHGVLSFSLPIFTLLFINIKPKGKNLGIFIISIAILQFVFGISLSYGVDGYIGDSLSLSTIFIFNTIFFLYIGIYNCIDTKKESNIN
ncbi:hypothetical protein ES731_15255 [Psychroflexus gondwanensis]|uniref:hypothetical protein n=1 Tax=Psychroflexus gondwanensis TaxID=251 RepID=UPI0011BF2D9D|nr:hypothetical protein [Psychroflexus gondwanensis]TXE15549.1 hypothetical protein ES731_15255 [Psychroflexus gondwanensis]